MRGNNDHLILQERDRHLLGEIAVMRVISRDQAMVVGPFGSVTRANARLLALTKTGLLRRLPLMLATRALLYTLTAKGADLIATEQQYPKLKTGGLFLEHQQQINSVFLAVKYKSIPDASIRFGCWRTFISELSAAARVIPDGYFELNTTTDVLAMFLEVDLGTEGLKDWKKKVEGYIHFAASGEFAASFNRTRFRVLVVADSETRLNAIRRTCAAYTDKIFWFATLDAIKGDGFWSTTWSRATGDEKQSLLARNL